MGTQAQARKLRRVVRALEAPEAARLNPSVAGQYRVRARTLRRAVYLRLTGSPSIMAVCHAFAVHEGAKNVKIADAVEWAAGEREQNPKWKLPETPVVSWSTSGSLGPKEMAAMGKAARRVKAAAEAAEAKAAAEAAST